MKFRIHFSVWEHEDYFEIEWNTIEEIREKAFAEEEKRWLTVEKNNLWSEKIDN